MQLLISRRRRVSLLALTGVLVVSLAACGSSSGSSQSVLSGGQVSTGNGLVIDGEQIADKPLLDAAKKEGSLSLYTGYTEETERQLVDQFRKDTGIAVNVVRLVPNRLVERVLSEQGAGKLAADVIRISDVNFADKMQKAGVWARYTSPELESVAKSNQQVQFDGGSYYRIFDSVYTFGYNTSVVKPADAPQSWKDLLDPKWAGKLGIVQGGSGGSAASLTRFMRTTLGADYLTQYAAQKPRIFDSLGAEAQSLARGEIAVGTVTVSGVNVSAAQKAPVTFVVPKEGVAVYDYFAGMTSAASHPNAAKLFLNWTLSKRGQALFSQIGEYAVRTDVAAPAVLGQTLPPLTGGKAVRLAPSDATQYTSSDLKYWNQVFGYGK